MSSPVLGTAYLQVPGTVGPSTSVADGSPANQRMGRDRTQIVQDGHARYQEAVYRGNVFFAATQAAITFSTSLTTTTVVGFVLSNPPNSGHSLSIIQCEVVPSGTTQVVGLYAISVQPFSSTAVAHTTALTVNPAYVGSTATAVGKADSGATLATAPAVYKILASTTTTNPSQIITPLTTDIAGLIVLQPGTAAAVMANAAVTAFVSMAWEEIAYP